MAARDELGFNPSTLSDYLRGARPSPANLGERIEFQRDLPAGSLCLGDSPKVEG